MKLRSLVVAAFLTAPVPGGEAHAGEMPADYSFNGAAALSGCSGSLFRFEGQSMDDVAYVLTNGHCITLSDTYEVLVDVDTDREVELYNAANVKAGTYTATKIVYSTMYRTDMAVLRLDATYQEIKDEADVDALVLARNRPTEGDGIVIVSGLWEYTTTCTIDGFVHSMLEGRWKFFDSLRFTAACETFGGTSGSPVISLATGEIVGVNNTGFENGEPCTRNNPCEVDENGEVTTVMDGSYGQQTYQLYGCVDDTFALDLDRPGCELPRPTGIMDLASVELTGALECDDDGILDAGETAILMVEVTNRGEGALTETTLVVSSPTSSVGFPAGDSVNVGAIAAGETATAEIEVALSEDASDLDIVVLELVLSDPSSPEPELRATRSVRVNVDEALASSRIDDVESPTSAWTLAAEGPGGWSRVADDAGNTVWYAVGIDRPGDQQLVSPALEVGDDDFVVTFSHRYRFETSRGVSYDGAVVELSTDGGATWSDASDHVGSIGYDDVLSADSGNVLGDRRAYAGESPDWPAMSTETLDFGTALAGATVHLRFRVGTDAAAGDHGWELDDIAVAGTENLPFPSLGADVCGDPATEDPDDDDPDGDEPPAAGCCSAGNGPEPGWFVLGFIVLMATRRRRSAAPVR